MCRLTPAVLSLPRTVERVEVGAEHAVEFRRDDHVARLQYGQQRCARRTIAERLGPRDAALLAGYAAMQGLTIDRMFVGHSAARIQSAALTVEPSLYANVDWQDDLASRWWPLGKESAVALDPEVMFGAPHISDTRAPTSIIAETVRAERGLSKPQPTGMG